MVGRPKKVIAENVRAIHARTCDRCFYAGLEKCEALEGPVWTENTLPPHRLTCESWINKTKNPAPFSQLPQFSLPLPELQKRRKGKERARVHFDVSYVADVDGNVAEQANRLASQYGFPNRSAFVRALIKAMEEDQT